MNAVVKSIYAVKANWNFMKLIKNPVDTVNIFNMTSAYQKSAPDAVVQQIVSRMFEDLDLKKDWENKYWPLVPSFEKLRTFPAKSFGHEAALFFERWHLDPDLFPDPDFSSAENYLTSRFYQAHDFWHVLTGYTPDIADELGLQAFGVAQYGAPISSTIIAGGMIHVNKNTPERAAEVLAAISEGFQMGLKAEKLLTAEIFKRLREPLEKVRADLNINAKLTQSLTKR